MVNQLRSFNTCIGLGAGKNLKIGKHNVFIGAEAGKDLTVSSNRLIIDSPDVVKVDIKMQEQDAIELTTVLSRILSKARIINNVLTYSPVGVTCDGRG